MVQELQSVKNALTILKCFTADNNRLRVTEISRQTGLAKSTVSRSLTTLANEGFVRKSSEDQSYLLGLTVLNLAGIALSSMRIQQEASPALGQLVVRTNESGHIAIMDGLDVVYVQKEESSVHTKMQTHLGRRNPAHATGSGKLLLAYQDQAFLDKFFRKNLVAYTSSTITNPIKMKDELNRIRASGYASAKDELTDGVSSLAVPIRDYSECVVASLALIGSTKRFTPRKIMELIPLMNAAAKEASRNLGYWK